ncbi:hypothetical protein TNCV_3282721 [Trichonephila clavipes]|nr:hypothetical protein TNCV_3282721 [Trichonephila clavipes]
MTSGALSSSFEEQCHTHNLLQVPMAELAERWTGNFRPGLEINPDRLFRVAILVISRVFAAYKSRVHRQLGIVLSPVLYRGSKR